jgi:hypothetical protein
MGADTKMLARNAELPGLSKGTSRKVLWDTCSIFKHDDGLAR